MKTKVRSTPFLMPTLAVISLLAGCSGSQLPAGAPGIAPHDSQIAWSSLSTAQLLADTMPHYVRAPAHANPGKSWMAPNARKIDKLLYVSDQYTNAVYVYNYDTGVPLGELLGFQGPYGQCVDAKGHIWITNFAGSSIVEYAHGGSSPLRTLTTDGSSIGCSIDPLTGNLAVANYATPSGPGDIQVFKQARRSPTSYSNPTACYYLWPPTYDSSGNLFVETKASNYVCEIVYGRSPETLSVDNSGFSRPTISFPGGATWDGTYLAFTDQQYGGRSTAAIYQVQEVVSGGLSVIGTTRLTDNCYANHTDVVQPFIVRKVVVGGNLVCTNQVDYWRYPFGGRPSSSLPSAPQAPYGQSVSIVR